MELNIEAKYKNKNITKSFKFSELDYTEDEWNLLTEREKIEVANEIVSSEFDIGYKLLHFYTN